MAQIYAALSYYHDHQKAIDDEIQRTLAEYRAARAAAPESAVSKKLRDMALGTWEGGLVIRFLDLSDG